MPLYEVVTQLANGHKTPIAPGAIVDIDEKEGEELVALGALRPARLVDEMGNDVILGVLSETEDGEPIVEPLPDASGPPADLTSADGVANPMQEPPATAAPATDAAPDAVAVIADAIADAVADGEVAGAPSEKETPPAQGEVPTGEAAPANAPRVRKGRAKA